MKIFTTKNTSLIDSLRETLDISNNFILEKFKDGEFLPRFTTSIRGEDLFLISQTSTSDDIISTLLSIDAAKRSGAKSISLILPYYPYSRQDKTDHTRSSIGSKMIADIYEKVGITQLITIDLHASSIQGFFSAPVIHLNGNKIFIKYIKSLELDNLCICAPDQGAHKKCADFAKAFPDSTFAVINKKRIKPNEIHSMELMGDVLDRNVLILDDLCDTGGTFKKAAEIVMSQGAKSVRAIVTHGVLSGPAIENIETSKLCEFIVSDTIDINIKSDKIKVISCANIISSAISGLHTKKSINEINIV
jgi:ribose-phosphate pyrophosphokinase